MRVGADIVAMVALLHVYILAIEMVLLLRAYTGPPQ